MKFARRMFALLATVMLLLMMFVLAQGRTIDIQGEVSNILRQHNDERRRVLASNMLEMVSVFIFRKTFRWDRVR